MTVQIGVIGGSGLYDMAELTDREEVTLTTPFGDPSGPYVVGTLRGKRVAFLARHGAGHRLLPSELNFRANIFGFKTARRRTDHLGQRRRQPQAGIPAARHRRARSVLRSHQGRASARSSAAAWSAHVAFAHPICPELAKVGADAVAGGRRDRPSRRHVRVHGGSAVLDARRVEAVPLVGHGRHRHDEPAGGEARARSGDLLRHARARHRLRLLASGPRLGHGRDDHRRR